MDQRPWIRSLGEWGAQRRAAAKVNVMDRSDLELIALWRANRLDENGNDPLDTLLTRYQDRIARWSLHILRDPSEAADCTQQILLRIFTRIHQFSGNGDFLGWTYAIARSVCFSMLEKKKRRAVREKAVSWSGEELADPRATAQEIVELTEVSDTLRKKVFSVLSPRESEAVHLRFIDGLPTATITERLELRNRSGARGVLLSAKRKLRKHLGREELDDLGFCTTLNFNEPSDPKGDAKGKAER